MTERPFKKTSDTRKPAPWWRRKLWWLTACAAISIVPLVLEILYLLFTRQQFSLIVSMPAVPAVAVIWCAMTIINISTLEEYKRAPFQLTLWISALAGLAALDLASYAIFWASNADLSFSLINLVPVAGTVAACFFAQRFMAQLETDGAGEHE